MPSTPQYRAIKAGVEKLPSGCTLPRHRHREGYATIVLSGHFTEASFAGRFHVRPGDVLLHGSFDCHCNWAARLIAPRILRLPWNDHFKEGLFAAADIDALVRLAERDPWEASAALAASLEVATRQEHDWPERLARDLTVDPSLSLGDWAHRHGVVVETVSRGFGRAFGVTPKLFRLEARTRAAWRSVISSNRTLTDIAHGERFADLAHMSRSISAFTGASPAQWRRAYAARLGMPSAVE